MQCRSNKVFSIETEQPSSEPVREVTVLTALTLEV